MINAKPEVDVCRKVLLGDDCGRRLQISRRNARSFVDSQQISTKTKQKTPRKDCDVRVQWVRRRWMSK